MELSTIQRQLGFTASSSQRLVQLPVSSGLPMQGSIAGCLAFEKEPHEWNASLMQLGHRRIRALDAPCHMAVTREKKLIAEVASAIQENVWIEQSGRQHVYISGCVLLSHTVQLSGVVSGFDHVLIVQLKRAISAESDTLEQEAPVADTNRPYTVQQMAQAWGMISKPVPEDDVSITVDPDDYPLF
jgi:hypothetical protein